MDYLEIKDVAVSLPVIRFDDYEKLKAQAEEIANFVSQVEVTEENVKEAKRLLAEINKSLGVLNRRRIDVKNYILAPYEAFNAKVKEIETIVKDADSLVRGQVREMEEAERAKKEQVLRDIWTKRIELYRFCKIFDFEDWLKPKHLNKTQAISKSEKEMTEFLEKSETDLEVLYGMDDADNLILEYRCCHDVAEAIQRTKAKHERLEEQERALEAVKKIAPGKIAFIVSEDQESFTELLLKTNNIEFEKRSI